MIQSKKIIGLTLLFLTIILGCTKSTLRTGSVTFYTICNLQVNQKLVISYPPNSNHVSITDTLTTGNYSATVNYTSGNQPKMIETFSAYIITGNTTHSTSGLSLKTISNGIVNNGFIRIVA